MDVIAVLQILVESNWGADGDRNIWVMQRKLLPQGSKASTLQLAVADSWIPRSCSSCLWEYPNFWPHWVPSRRCRAPWELVGVVPLRFLRFCLVLFLAFLFCGPVCSSHWVWKSGRGILWPRYKIFFCVHLEAVTIWCHTISKILFSYSWTCAIIPICSAAPASLWEGHVDVSKAQAPDFFLSLAFKCCLCLGTWNALWFCLPVSERSLVKCRTNQEMTVLETEGFSLVSSAKIMDLSTVMDTQPLFIVM